MLNFKRTSLFFVLTAILLATAGCATRAAAQAPNATLYEGARLIVGDGTVVENSAFLVENTQFTRVGRKGQVQAPANARRVDLTGKTIIPGKVDLHGHIGYQHPSDGTMAKEYFT